MNSVESILELAFDAPSPRGRGWARLAGLKRRDTVVDLRRALNRLQTPALLPLFKVEDDEGLVEMLVKTLETLLWVAEQIPDGTWGFIAPDMRKR